jgi:hypothetical protein
VAVCCCVGRLRSGENAVTVAKNQGRQKATSSFQIQTFSKFIVTIQTIHDFTKFSLFFTVPGMNFFFPLQPSRPIFQPIGFAIAADNLPYKSRSNKRRRFECIEKDLKIFARISVGAQR